DFVELDGDQQDRLAGIAHLDDLIVNELNGADVDAARWLADDQYGGVMLHLARQNDLLLVAAGKARRLEPRIGRTHVEFLHTLQRLLARRGDVEQSAFGIGSIVLIAEDAVFPFFELHHEALALAVLGNVRETCGARPCRTIVALERERAAIDDDIARLLVAHAGDAFEQLRLAIAGDAGDPDDFAGADREEHTSELQS